MFDFVIKRRYCATVYYDLKSERSSINCDITLYDKLTVLCKWLAVLSCVILSCNWFCVICEHGQFFCIPKLISAGDKSFYVLLSW